MVFVLLPHLIVSSPLVVSVRVSGTIFESGFLVLGYISFSYLFLRDFVSIFLN